MERNTFPDIPGEVKITQEGAVSAFQEFIRDKKIILDVGCGHGDFLIEYTENQKDNFFVGIEIWRKRLHKTGMRLHKRGRANFALLHGGGEEVLQLAFAPSSADEIYVNFPDPWLKPKQWKNRIFKPSFLIQAIRVLKTGGLLHLVTDVEEYALYVGGILSRYPFLENVHDRLIVKNLYSSFPTLFYKKMSPLRDINYLTFRKTGDPA